MIRDILLTFTTNGSGAATTTATESVSGRLVAAEFNISAMDAGSDYTISVTSTPGGVDRTLFTLTNSNTNAWYDVRGLGSDAAAASSSEYVHPAAIGAPKVVVAQGGATKTGKVILYFEVDSE